MAQVDKLHPEVLGRMRPGDNGLAEPSDEEIEDEDAEEDEWLDELDENGEPVAKPPPAVPYPVPTPGVPPPPPTQPPSTTFDQTKDRTGLVIAAPSQHIRWDIWNDPKPPIEVTPLTFVQKLWTFDTDTEGFTDGHDPHFIQWTEQHIYLQNQLGLGVGGFWWEGTWNDLGVPANYYPWRFQIWVDFNAAPQQEHQFDENAVGVAVSIQEQVYPYYIGTSINQFFTDIPVNYWQPIEGIMKVIDYNSREPLHLIHLNFQCSSNINYFPPAFCAFDNVRIVIEVNPDKFYNP